MSGNGGLARRRTQGAQHPPKPVVPKPANIQKKTNYRDRRWTR